MAEPMTDVLTPEQVAEIRDARHECAEENRALREQLREQQDVIDAMSEQLREVQTIGETYEATMHHQAREIRRLTDALRGCQEYIAALHPDEYSEPVLLAARRALAEIEGAENGTD